MSIQMIILAFFLFSGSANAVTLISRSYGLENPSKESGHTELEFGDINGDGYLDLVSVGDHGSPWINSDQHGIMVWLGDGSGIWSVIQTGEFGYGGCAVGDLNLDGYMDVAWGIHHNSGSGGFGDRLMGAALGNGTGSDWVPWDDGLATGGEEYGMFATDVADFDVDGDLDIVCESFGSGNGVRVYENHFDGTWSQAWLIDGGNAAYTIETGDFNADGLPDFICTRLGTHIYFGDGNLEFTLNQSGISSIYMISVDCGDFNGDGRDDIVCSFGSDSGVHCYYFEEGSLQWVDASIGLPSGGSYVDMVQFGYIDGDDHLDLVLYDDPVGQVYLGDGTGTWTPDASWTMPGSGDASALRIDGDIDHDGREDIAIQGEMMVGGWEENQLRLYSPWLEPAALSERIITPDGGETLIELSIREIRWLTAVPFQQDQATVDLYFSISGAGGPWSLIAAGVPDNGSYQWIVPQVNSSTCRLRVVAETAVDTVEDISDEDFIICGTTGIENCQLNPLNPTELKVIPNPAASVPILEISPVPAGPVTVSVLDITGRVVYLIETGNGNGYQIPLTGGSGESLNSGVYFVRVQTDSADMMTRFVQL